MRRTTVNELIETAQVIAWLVVVVWILSWFE